jgi:hypothetical protein
MTAAVSCGPSSPVPFMLLAAGASILGASGLGQVYLERIGA